MASLSREAAMISQTYLAYCLALAAGMVTPGPGNVQAMTLGMRHGARPVAAAALGFVCAILVQVPVVLFGLSLLAREPLVLRLVGALGALYLAWLGLRMWQSPVRLDLPDAEVPTARLAGLFGQGLLVAAFNPKAWGFLMAMLPRFAASGMPDAAGVAWLAGPVCLLGFGGMMAYAVLGAALARLLTRPTALRRVFRAMAVVIWACAACFAAG